MNHPAFWGGLAFTVLALYLLHHAWKSFKVGDTSKHWPSVIGRITHSQVVRYSMNSSRRDLSVEYEYTVDNNHYRGNRVALYTLMHDDEVKTLAERFPENTQVPIYYEPSNPNFSLLVTGLRSSKKSGEMIMAVTALVFGIVISVAGYLGLLT